MIELLIKYKSNLNASDRRREYVECSKRHIKTTLNILPRLVQKNISHLRVFGRTFDELVHNQRVCRDCDETYKERTYHYLLQCPRTTRWRESLLLHLPEERFHERSEAMIGLVLNTQATRNYKELKILVAKFPILDGLIAR